MKFDFAELRERMTQIKDELMRHYGNLEQKLKPPIAVPTYEDDVLGNVWGAGRRVLNEPTEKKETTIPTSTPAPEPSPPPAKPTKAEVTAPETTSTPQPAPTPVQEYYRSEEIAGNLDNKDFAKKYDKATEVIEKYGQKYMVPVNLMVDIAFAESSLDPNLEGPTQDVGLFQFTPGTWRETMIRMKMEQFTPLQHRKKPWLNTMAAAYLISQGELSRWNASKGKWGQYYTDEELEAFY